MKRKLVTLLGVALLAGAAWIIWSLLQSRYVFEIRIRLRFSHNFPPGLQQRLRNAWQAAG